MDSTETVAAAISACVAALALVLAAIAVRTIRARSDTRFEVVLARLDDHLGAISGALARVVERAENVRARAVDDLELTVDFEDLLHRIASEAASRTGADAAAVQVRGPGGQLVSAEFGVVSRAPSLDAPFARASGPFRAVTINWSYGPGNPGATDPVTSALVVPIVEDGHETGALAAYAPESWVFGPEHVQALESLAAEAGPALAAARDFANVQRELTDASTGVRNRAGYEVELERAVRRARESGKPLSLLILSRAAGVSEAPVGDDDPVTRQLASLLVRTTRATDVVCRRQEGEFGIVLRDTAGDPARRFYGRLREAASHTSFGTARQLTYASGLVEWKRNETSEALDARAFAAVGHDQSESLELQPLDDEADVPASAAPSFRSMFLERLAREIDRARHLERPLALLVVRVDGIRQIEEAYGATAADRVLDEVESRLRDALGHGDLAARLAEDALAAIFPSAESGRAESAFGAFQASLQIDPATHLDRLAVAAGISELAAADDGELVVERAEHALERAVAAGHGTVVVALAAEEPER